MNKSSVFNSRPTPLSKSTSGHAHSSRIMDPLHKMLMFSTPLLGRRGLNVSSRRTGNDSAAEFTGTLERSYSLNAKRRRNVASSCGHVSSSDLKSSCLLPSTDPVPRYNVRLSFWPTKREYLDNNKYAEDILTVTVRIAIQLFLQSRYL